MIKRRVTKAPRTYHEFREDWWLRALNWKDRGVKEFDPQKDQWKTGPVFQSDERVLVPRYGYQDDDTWHCGGNAAARIIAREILGFPDVIGLTLQGRWVRVSWDTTGKKTELFDQWQDPRERLRS